MSEVIARKIGGYTIIKAGSVWKVAYHGTWIATTNDEDDAVGYVEASIAGKPYAIRRALSEPSP